MLNKNSQNTGFKNCKTMYYKIIKKEQKHVWKNYGVG